MIKAPTTPEEFLRNVKFVIDNELLIDEAFFTEENLMRFYQKTKVEFANGDTWMSANIGGGNEFSTSFGWGFADVHLKKVDAAGKESQSGHLRGSTGIDMNFEKSFSVDVVLRTLGPWDEIRDPFKSDNLQHPQPLRPAIHPMGNKSVSYLYETTKTKSTLGILFAFNGNVRKFGFTQEEK